MHRRTRERLRDHLSLIPLLGIVPSFLLAVYSLTQPWARARVLLVWGISRSPGAVLLLSVTLAAMVAVSVAVALRGRRLGIAGAVHLATGLVMGGICWAAFRMILHSGKDLLGIIPVAVVRPGRGLRLFALAAILVGILGVAELLVARWRAMGAGAPPQAAATID